ncbi:threonylcarbamoyl-AMP synthase [Candidatus Saccharibacteria bacterium]|nr:threonylcarbamoyl-AMP synthase [Candidatus Saccharibacteria bacterium]
MSYVTDSFDDEVIALLQKGGVGLMPTDTIYGLSCIALNKASVETIHKIKRRDKTKPFVVLISKIEQLNDLGIITTDAAPALRYWPGKLTLICPALKAPGWLQMSTGALAIRQPDHPKLRELIDKVGPIVSTSVNLAGRKPAVSIAEAREYFGDKLDFYVNAGKFVGQPSTIVKSSFKGLEIIRPGAVKIN